MHCFSVFVDKRPDMVYDRRSMENAMTGKSRMPASKREQAAGASLWTRFLNVASERTAEQQ